MNKLSKTFHYVETSAFNQIYLTQEHPEENKNLYYCKPNKNQKAYTYYFFTKQSKTHSQTNNIFLN